MILTLVFTVDALLSHGHLRQTQIDRVQRLQQDEKQLVIAVINPYDKYVLQALHLACLSRWW